MDKERILEIIANNRQHWTQDRLHVNHRGHDRYCNLGALLHYFGLPDDRMGAGKVYGLLDNQPHYASDYLSNITGLDGKIFRSIVAINDEALNFDHNLKACKALLLENVSVDKAVLIARELK